MSTIKPLVHITLNSGHFATVPEDMAYPETRKLLEPIIAARQGNLPGLGAAYRVEISKQLGVAVFTLFRGKEPLTLNVVCCASSESESAWKLIERVYLQLSDQAPQLIAATASPDQPRLPWLATVLLPGLGMIVPE